MIERQELYCHGCDKYIQFDVDMSLNGNHMFKCPNCGHEHYRVVKDGKITEDRYNPGFATYQVSTNSITWTITSTFTTYTTTNSTTTNFTPTEKYFLYTSWSNTTSTK